MLAVVVVNWSAFSGNPMLEQLRCMLMFIIIFMVFLNSMMGLGASGSSNVDGLGHLGGAITGFVWGLAFMPRADGPSGQTMKKVGMGLTVLFFGLTIGLLWGLN